MAKQQPKSGWLRRRREAKRVNTETRAQQIANKRQYEAAGSAHATRNWESSGGGGGI